MHNPILLISFTLLSILHWSSYFNGNALTISALGRASQNGGELNLVAASTFILHLCFLACLINVYRLYGKVEKIYAVGIAIAIVTCGMSYVLTGSLFGSANLAIYEPIFITFLAVNAIAFQLGIAPREYSAIET